MRTVYNRACFALEGHSSQGFHLFSLLWQSIPTNPTISADGSNDEGGGDDG